MQIGLSHTFSSLIVACTSGYQAANTWTSSKEQGALSSAGLEDLSTPLTASLLTHLGHTFSTQSHMVETWSSVLSIHIMLKDGKSFMLLYVLQLSNAFKQSRSQYCFVKDLP